MIQKTDAISAMMVWVLFHLAILTPVLGQSLSPKDLEHGIKQVEKMLHDNLGMAYYKLGKNSGLKYVDENDSIYQWAVNAFAGRDTGERVFWDKHGVSKAIARHTTARHAGIFTIGVRDVTETNVNSFEIMWAAFIYMVIKVGDEQQWMRLEKAAKERSIASESFVIECARLDYAAYKKFRAFHNTEWLKWCEEHDFKSEAHIWHENEDTSFETWIKQWTDKEEYPWVPYLEKYE
ncbi:MAG: hypothetical protein RL693_2125, partial [Verrucomicrobiota bacterium]